MTCGDRHPNHLEIGLVLASVGKSLADRRKVAVHWPSSGVGPQNEPVINFMDFRWLVAQQVSQKTVTDHREDQELQFSSGISQEEESQGAQYEDA